VRLGRVALGRAGARTEDGLWPVRDAFHEWVYGDEGEGGRAEEDAEGEEKVRRHEGRHPSTCL
jgi:hypothetical protein